MNEEEIIKQAESAANDENKNWKTDERDRAYPPCCVCGDGENKRRDIFCGRVFSSEPDSPNDPVVSICYECYRKLIANNMVDRKIDVMKRHNENEYHLKDKDGNYVPELVEYQKKMDEIMKGCFDIAKKEMEERGIEDGEE